MDAKERETAYLYVSTMMIIFPIGYGMWSVFGDLIGISAMIATGGFLAFLRTVLTIKIAELELHLKPVIE